jgi:hypothetical protein
MALEELNIWPTLRPFDKMSVDEVAGLVAALPYTLSAYCEHVPVCNDWEEVQQLIDGVGMIRREMDGVSLDFAKKAEGEEAGEEELISPASPVESEDEQTSPTSPVQSEDEENEEASPASPVESEDEDASPASPLDSEDEDASPASPVDSEAEDDEDVVMG